MNEFEQEFWYARELQKVLNYSQWRRFETAISRAMDTCKNSGNDIEEHFAQVRNMISIGHGAKEIHARKGLKKGQQILDHMGSTELAANLFRTTQTDEKIRREQVVGKDEAGEVHFKVGQKVRQTIADLGGTMPEDLPTPEKSIQQIEKEQIERLKIKAKDKMLMLDE